MKYPNLAEVIKYHPYHISTFAGFAEVTTELLEAVLAGKENLTDEELRKIARYSGVPYGVITCPKLIWMDNHRARHQQMINELSDSLSDIQSEQKNGSEEADHFMKYGRAQVVNTELAFLDGRATYAMYLGSKERVTQVQGFIETERRKPRDIERRAAG